MDNIDATSVGVSAAEILAGKPTEIEVCERENATHSSWTGSQYAFVEDSTSVYPGEAASLTAQAYDSIIRETWVVSLHHHISAHEAEHELHGPVWLTPEAATTFAYQLLAVAREVRNRNKL